MAKNTNPQASQANGERRNPEGKGYEKTIARWTIVLGISTIVLSFATILSAYFLYETDQTIKKQVAATSIQLRAYAGVNQFSYNVALKKEADKPDVFIGAQVLITWKNFGATPAKGFEGWISVKWMPPGTEPDFSKPTVALIERSKITLGTGGETTMGPLFIAAEDIRKAMAGNGRVFVWGRATYQDSFPDTPFRNTHFCMFGLSMPEVIGAPSSFAAYKPECNYSD